MEKMSFLIRQTILVYISLLFLLVLNTTVAFAEITDGSVARENLIIEVRTLLHQEKYDELESMAQKYRKDKTRFPDGGWKLSCFYATFADAYYGWDELFRNLDTWSKKFPDSITARVAAGKAWLSFAWKARGGGYANTVTKEGWKLYQERVAKAYELVKNQSSDPSRDCIHRYKLLLEISREQSWDREKHEALFQKAISFEPLYYAYYFQKAYYLLPRWHGEEGEWQKFADEAVKLAPESEGMGIYTRILWSIWGNNEFKEFREPDISWKKMKQGFRDIERQYPNSPSNLNYFCMFACIAGDKETAKELFKRIGAEPYTEVWKGRSNFIKWQRWAGVD